MVSVVAFLVVLSVFGFFVVVVGFSCANVTAVKLKSAKAASIKRFMFLVFLMIIYFAISLRAKSFGKQAIIIDRMLMKDL